MRNYRFISLIILVLALVSCNRPIRYDLIVENASIFNTNTGEVIPNKTILIIADTIVGIINSDEPVRTKKVIDADGRLVVPGFIDTHISFEKAIFSTHKNADNHPKTLTTFYRSKFSKLFLPYGVTTAVDMTKDLNWADQMVKWEKNPKFSDLIVEYNFPNNETSKERIDVAISDLSAIGVKYLYINNDRDSEFVDNVHQIAIHKKLDVFVKPISTFTDNKIENIEHIYSPIISIVETNGYKDILLKQIENVYGNNQEIPEEIYALEAFKFIVENNPKLIDTIVNKLSSHPFSISTTLHSLAQYSDSTYLKSTIDSQIKLTKELKHRITYNFNHFLNFVKRVYDSGTILRIGTNCCNGGLTFISEQLLLAEAGIPVADILKISTINAAKVLKIDNQIGSIEVGKRADIVIYDQNPLDNYKNFASTRRVIKGGRLFKRNTAKIDMEE